MSGEWIKFEVRAGGELADRLVSDGKNPIHLAVLLGTAMGRVASKVFEVNGQTAAEGFLKAAAAVFNQETLGVDPSQRLTLRGPCS